MKKLLNPVLILTLIQASIFISGCHKTFRTRIKVLKEFIINSKNGPVTLSPGEYNIKFEIKRESKKKSTITFYSLPGTGENKTLVTFNLPPADDFFYVNEIRKIDALSLDQQFSIIVTGNMDNGIEQTGVSIYSKDFSEELATIVLNHKPNDSSLNSERKQFLRSYQEVKYNQRAAVFGINADFDAMVYMGKNWNWITKTIDAIINFGAKLYIAPWVYARYSNVKWILGDKPRAYIKAAWEEVYEKYPVVDYFSSVHNGGEYHMFSEPLRKHQLRMAYTSACHSGTSSHFVTKNNAAGAAGHRATSASPFFTFSIIRNWIYGKSLQESAVRGFRHGRALLKVLGFVSFSSLWEKRFGFFSYYYRNLEDVIYKSTPGFSFHESLPADKIFVNRAALPERTVKSEDNRLVKCYSDETINGTGDCYLPEENFNEEPEQQGP